jgi:asparagine synthetase B (glutamine-hydrolysing)
MCGHAGMIGTGMSRDDIHILRELGIVSQLRGLDGAGIFQVRSTKPNYVSSNSTYLDWDSFYKTPYPYSNMLLEVEASKNPQVRDVLNNTMVDVVMMHVRASTRGVVSMDNAHPFEFDNLVGAHNGTLKDQKYNQHPTKTDSEMMFRDISQNGLGNILNKMDRDSAYAIVMYNKADRCVYFARNELRTMAFAFLKDRSVMYYASDYNMLKYVLDRANEEYTIYHMKPRVIIKVKASDINKTKWNAPLDTLQVHEKLTQSHPVAWNKFYEAEARKQKAEKKEEQVKKVDEKFKIPMAAPSQQALVTVPEKKEDTNNIVNFPKGQTPQTKEPGLKFSPKGSYVKCVCGCSTLNLFQADLAMRGQHKSVTYHSDDQFRCTNCPEYKLGKAEENAVG